MSVSVFCLIHCLNRLTVLLVSAVNVHVTMSLGSDRYCAVSFSIVGRTTIQLSYLCGIFLEGPDEYQNGPIPW